MSIKLKLLIAFVLVFSFLIIGYALFMYHRVRSTAVDQLDARIELFAERFKAELDESERDHPLLTPEDITDAQKETLEPFKIRLTKPDGMIIFSDTLFAAIHQPLVQETGTDRFIFDDVTMGTDAYRTARTLQHDTGQSYILDIAARMTDIETGLRQLRWSFYVTIPFAFFLATLAAYGITLVGFRPLTMMIESARDISGSNLDRQLPVPASDDEVRLLGLTFNSMIGRIATAFKSQKQFIADASHEFRTPLTIINSELEYALRRVSKKKREESIHTALTEVDHLKKLTDDLLLIAKLDSHQLPLRKKIFRVDELLIDCARKVTHLGSVKKISFRLHIEPGVELFGDEEKIGGVIVNVIDNAVKYGKKNSVIHLTLHRNHSHSLVIEVTNTGAGIPSDQIDRIFDRFFRGNTSRFEHTGSGLGLSIAKQIVELHNGRISAVSTPNKKTTITITIPLVPQ